MSDKDPAVKVLPVDIRKGIDWYGFCCADIEMGPVSVKVFQRDGAIYVQAWNPSGELVRIPCVDPFGINYRVDVAEYLAAMEDKSDDAS
jgi:hypothetical protein